jgi:hypothetical protein
MNGYEQTYEVIVPRLRECDFSDAARRLGFELPSKDRLIINFLGRTYMITKNGVSPLDGSSVNVNILSVLVYYAISQGKGEPLYDFTMLHNFSRGLFSHGGADWMTAPLRKAFGGGHSQFRKAALALGMVFQGSEKSGEYPWLYQLLPKIPVRVVYYQGDDEFPCGVDIFYDKTAPLFLDFEPLAVLNGCFISALAAMAV